MHQLAFHLQFESFEKSCNGRKKNKAIKKCNLFLEIQSAKSSGKPFRDQRYVDVYREKQIRVVVKVIVPVKEHPKFNFVGKQNPVFVS